MKRLTILVISLLFAVGVMAQSRRVDFSITVPVGADTIITIPAYSTEGYSIFLNFNNADAFDGTLDVGTALERDDGKFVGLSTIIATLPSTLDLTTWPDTLFVAEKGYMPFSIVKLKLTRGTVTPGLKYTGRIEFTK